MMPLGWAWMFVFVILSYFFYLVVFYYFYWSLILMESVDFLGSGFYNWLW